MDTEREEAKLTPASPTHTGVLIPTSVVLQRLHDEAPTDHFTLGARQVASRLSSNLARRCPAIALIQAKLSWMRLWSGSR